MALSKAIEIAVKMEKDAIAFYREALDKTDHPTAVKMFERFIKVEIQHLRMLNNLVKKVDPKAKLTYPEDNVESVFSKHKDEMMSRVNVSTDEMEAVRLARDFEKEGYDFYKEQSAKAESEEERDMFKILTTQEEAHYIVLDRGYKEMEKTGKWFKWEDVGISENF